MAEHIASLPSEQAVQELLPHLWYDPDWEYAAPAAIAMHPKRDQVLKELISRVTGGESLRTRFCRWLLGIRRFLARVAEESGEGDWLREAAELIGQARIDLVTSDQSSVHAVAATRWPTSSRPIIGWLLHARRDQSLGSPKAGGRRRAEPTTAGAGDGQADPF